MSISLNYGINAVIYGPSKSGKALALDTPLPTPTGWTTIGEVQPGDELFNADGEITRVVAIGPVWTDRPCRRVTVMGDEIIADAGHVWQASRPKGDNLGTKALVETDQLIVSPGTFRSLPWTPELQLPDTNLKVHPYVVGAWLGDGDTNGSDLGFSDVKKLSVLEQCVDLYESGEIRKDDEGRYTAFLPGLKKAMTDIGARIEIGGKWVKKIPQNYLRSGTEQRRNLLAGLMDTDGYINPKVTEFTTVSKDIAHCVAELSCSLGLRAHVNGPYESSYTIDGTRYPARDHYDVRIRGVVRAHGITRRLDRESITPETRNKQYYRLHVNSVDVIDSVPVRCIQVDDLHGMFLAGRSMIPTHNSTLGDTTPAPRVVLDAEMGSRFTPSRKIEWDPVRYAPPVPDGTWDTAIVTVRDYATVNKAYEWLNSGNHPFKSVILDSISEIQQRGVDAIAGSDIMKTQDWGTLLRQVSETVRKFRDLTTHPVTPMDAVIFIAMAKKPDNESWRPYVQGQLATTLPYYVDLCAYLQQVTLEDGTSVRRLFIDNVPGYLVGERVGGRLGQYIDNPTVTGMLDMIRGVDNSTTENDTKETMG